MFHQDASRCQRVQQAIQLLRMRRCGLGKLCIRAATVLEQIGDTE
jgi:hypothetical protein